MKRFCKKLGAIVFGFIFICTSNYVVNFDRSTYALITKWTRVSCSTKIEMLSLVCKCHILIFLWLLDHFTSGFQSLASKTFMAYIIGIICDIEIGAVHKLCRLKIGDFWPSSLLCRLFTRKVNSTIFDPFSPPLSRRHSLWTVTYSNLKIFFDWHSWVISNLAKTRMNQIIW